jgi:putative hydrolase of the HAD superfamily
VVTRGVVFDLDDTLYLEREYVRSGFEHVAGVLGRSPRERRELAAWLWRAFEAGVRGDTFDRLLAAHPGLAGRITVTKLVDAYRCHPPDISLLPRVVELLEQLRARDIRMGVLSDGPLASQQAKAAALQLGGWFDPIVFTASQQEAFAKPGTMGFEWIAATWGLPNADLAYVADNPVKDFIGPRKLGWLTLRLRMPKQLPFALEPIGNGDQPDVEIGDLPNLLDHLG